MTNTDLEQVLERCASFNPEVRELGWRALDRLYQAGVSEAGVELAYLVVSKDFACSLSKPDAVRLLVDDVRSNGSGSTFLNIYYYAGDLVSDDEMEELLTLAAPNSAEAAEILEARLPGWRHPLA